MIFRTPRPSGSLSEDIWRTEAAGSDFMLQLTMIRTLNGHDDKIFTDATQNKLIIAGLRWLVATDKKENVFGDK
jgi:hypothetical protein